MTTVQLDFQKRALEVEGYFQFVEGMITADADKLFSLHKASTMQPALSGDSMDSLQKTLKATCYLLLYNLIESTMRNAVVEIFNELKTQDVSFDACRKELKLEVLKNFRKRSPEKILPVLLDFARYIVHGTFQSSEIFSGNLDARTIRETAERYGFEPPVKKSWTLRAVKDLRNDLAHGVKSFADVGRDTTISDLELARVQTVEVLTETLANINEYLRQKRYLEVIPVPVPAEHAPEQGNPSPTVHN